MAKSKNGPRSNFSLLPFELQYKIIAMIQDGATFATIAADSEIAEAYRSRGLKLTAPAISRLKKSEQYKAWTDQRLKERSSFTADRLTTAFLRENDSLDTIAEQTKVALLKLVQECVAGAEDTKEVERLGDALEHRERQPDRRSPPETRTRRCGNRGTQGRTRRT